MRRYIADGITVHRIASLAGRVVHYLLGAPEDSPGVGPGGAPRSASARDADLLRAQEGALADALSELDALRQRVDRLETTVHGEPALAGVPGLDRPGDDGPGAAAEPGAGVR